MTIFPTLRGRLSATLAAATVLAGLSLLTWAIITGRINFFAATGQTIVLSPAVTTVNLNQVFPVTVQVSTNGLNTVVATAEITYNSADLAVESFTPVGNNLGTADTVYDYKVEEVNTTGLIRITRGQPGDKSTSDSDDGFTGTNGKFVVVNFKAIRQSSTPITSTITVASTNSKLIADDGNGTNELDSVVGTTVTINAAAGDTTPPGNVTGATTIPGAGQLTVSWVNPADTDLAGIMILRKSGSGVTSGAPAAGTLCSVGATQGDATVASCQLTPPFINTGLTNGTTYHYKLFAFDTSKNYNATGATTSGTPVAAPTLTIASFTANPASGTAPLNDVDLTVDVGGTVTGLIRYRFDCTNDGVFEIDMTSSQDPHTHVDACDYPAAGAYTAKVRVDRGGLFVELTATITVSSVSVPPVPTPPVPPTPPAPAVGLCLPSTNSADYRHAWVSQNGYPTLDWNQSYKFTVTVKNTGTATWCRGKVNLGTDRSRDRIPGFIREGGNPSGWFTENRVELVQGSVAPGQEGAFVFWYTVPSGKDPGTYREYFRLVADGVTWLEDYGIYWDVLVPTLADAYHAQFVAQNGYPTLQRGQSYQFEVKLKNTGSKTWERGTVNLGTDRPRDVIWNFIRGGGTPTGWLNDNRVFLVENSVAPGAVGTFRFWYTAALNKPFGTYRDYYRPVADGITWMDDWGIYWDITVVP